MDLNDAQLIELAGSHAFRRGARYAKHGRVDLQEHTPQRLRAMVIGTQHYRLQLDNDGGKLDWNCDCPDADDGDFCKHLVAMVIAARTWTAPLPPPEPPPDERHNELRAFLRTQPAELLADWLMELADKDALVDKRLRLRLFQAHPPTLRKPTEGD